MRILNMKVIKMKDGVRSESALMPTASRVAKRRARQKYKSASL